MTIKRTNQRPSASFSKTLIALGVICGIPHASAALLLDPAGGTVYNTAAQFGNDADDGTFNGAFVPTASFFGLPTGIGPTVSLNGYLYLYNNDSNKGSVLGLLGTTGMTRIAPFWMDLKLGTGSQVIENSTNDYYAVTWDHMESFEAPGTYATFQAIFFDSATTLNGISFSAGEIAFSYGDVGAYDQSTEVIIGLEDLTEVATLPGNEAFNGWNSIQAGAFPVAADQFARFTPDGSGGYTTGFAVVPEPSSLLMGVAGAALLLRRRKA